VDLKSSYRARVVPVESTKKMKDKNSKKHKEVIRQVIKECRPHSTSGPCGTKEERFEKTTVTKKELIT